MNLSLLFLICSFLLRDAWGFRGGRFNHVSTNTVRKVFQPLRLVEDASPVIDGTDPPDETAEEKYKREKLAEIAEKKAQEIFISRSTGKYECQACGYIYDSAVGFPKKGIAPGTPFDDIEVFRCPQCGANKKYFVAETETLSGFKENQKFGFGGNSMTAGAKSNLIFGGLGIFFVLFLSGYLLD